MKLTQVHTSPFFRASCGCIGLDVGQNKWVVVRGCDGSYDCDPYELAAPCRGWDDDKDYTPFTAEETDAILIILGRAMSQGYRLDEIRHRINRGPCDPYLDSAIELLDKAQQKFNESR